MHKVLETIHGPMSLCDLAQTLGVESRPTAIVLWIEYRLPGVDTDDRPTGELVRRDAYRFPIETGDTIYTIHGDVPRDTLIRTIEVTDGEQDIAVAVVWKQAGEVVRRDVHLVLKHPTAESAAVAAALK